MIPATTIPAAAATAVNHSNDRITILGFGSLLSERSARITFPALANFRLARVRNYRRIFAHATSIFLQRGIAHLPSQQMSSLSVESCPGSDGFVATVFDVPNDSMMQDGIPSLAFLEREEEFDIIQVPFEEMEEVYRDNGDATTHPKIGIRFGTGRKTLVCVPVPYIFVTATWPPRTWVTCASIPFWTRPFWSTARQRSANMWQSIQKFWIRNHPPNSKNDTVDNMNARFMINHRFTLYVHTSLL
jgi:hypothetical protein